MIQTKKWFARIGIVLGVAALGYFTWQSLKPPSLPPGIASANGGTEGLANLQ
jgi:hypothetical protein